MLMRSGNVGRFSRTIRQVVRHRRNGINPAQDLPELGPSARGLLSPLESIKRDAITQSLLEERQGESGGGGLAMSRAIDLPQDPRVAGVVTSSAMGPGDRRLRERACHLG